MSDKAALRGPLISEKGTGETIAFQRRRSSTFKFDQDGAYQESGTEQALAVGRYLNARRASGAALTVTTEQLDQLRQTSPESVKSTDSKGRTPSLGELADGQVDIGQDDGKASLGETTLNATLALVGAGVLGLPYAFGKVGLGGLVIVLAITALTCWTAIAIGRLMKSMEPFAEQLKVPPSAVDWPFLGFIAFGDAGRALCSFVFVFELWFVLLAYLVANGINAHIILPSVPRQVGIIASGSLAFVLLFPSAKVLSYFSIFGILSTISAVGSLAWSAAVMPEWEMKDDFKIMEPAGLPAAIGIIQFCFVAHSAFPTMYRSMEDPSQFPTAMKRAFAFAGCFYTVVGVSAYCFYGKMAQESFMLNLGKDTNLQDLPGLSFLYLVATGCFLVNLQFSFPIFAAALIAASENWLGIAGSSAGIRTTWKFVFMVITTIVASALQDCMAPIQSLTGCFCATFTCLLMPMVFLVKVCGGGGPLKFFVTLGVIYGLYVLIYGTYSNTLDMIKILSANTTAS